MSSHQLHTMLGITYKTAWFMTHRIREAMRPEPSGLPGSNGRHGRTKHLQGYVTEFDFRYNHRSRRGIEAEDRT